MGKIKCKAVIVWINKQGIYQLEQDLCQDFLMLTKKVMLRSNYLKEQGFKVVKAEVITV